MPLLIDVWSNPLNRLMNFESIDQKYGLFLESRFLKGPEVFTPGPFRFPRPFYPAPIPLTPIANPSAYPKN